MAARKNTFDKIMDLAENDSAIALGALQEALFLLNGACQKKVLEYIESEEYDEG